MNRDRAVELAHAIIDAAADRAPKMRDVDPHVLRMIVQETIEKLLPLYELPPNE